MIRIAVLNESTAIADDDVKAMLPASGITVSTNHSK